MQNNEPQSKLYTFYTEVNTNILDINLKHKTLKLLQKKNLKKFLWPGVRLRGLRYDTKSTISPKRL
jgi:hypothetical protein